MEQAVKESDLKMRIIEKIKSLNKLQWFLIALIFIIAATAIVSKVKSPEVNERGFIKVEGGKTYAVNKMSSTKAYFIKPGDKFRGKINEDIEVEIVITPKIASKYELFLTKSRWRYQIPLDAKPGVYNLAIITKEKNVNQPPKVKNFKFVIVEREGKKTDTGIVKNAYAQEEGAEVSCEPVFLYPECSSTPGMVHEVYKNPCTGEYKIRNEHEQPDACQSSGEDNDDDSGGDSLPPSIDLDAVPESALGQLTNPSSFGNLLFTPGISSGNLNYSRIPEGAYNNNEAACSVNNTISVLYECSKNDEGYRACWNDYFPYQQEEPLSCLYGTNSSNYFHCQTVQSIDEISDPECQNILRIQENNTSTENAEVEFLSQDTCGQGGYEQMQIPTSCRQNYRCFDQYMRGPITGCLWQRGRIGNGEETSRCVSVSPTEANNCGIKTSSVGGRSDSSFNRGFKESIGDEYPVVLSLFHQLDVFPAVDLYSTDLETGKKEIVYYSKEAYEGEFCSGSEENCVTRFVNYTLKDWVEYFVEPDRPNNGLLLTDILKASASQCISKQAALSIYNPVFERMIGEGRLNPNTGVDELFRLSGYNSSIASCQSASKTIRIEVEEKDVSPIITTVAIGYYYHDNFEAFRGLLDVIPFFNVGGLYDLISGNQYINETDKKFILAGVLFDSVSGGGKGFVSRVVEGLSSVNGSAGSLSRGKKLLEVARSSGVGYISSAAIRGVKKNAESSSKAVGLVLEYVKNRGQLLLSPNRIVVFKQELTESNLVQRFGPKLSEGNFGTTYLNRNEGAVVKIFKEGSIEGEDGELWNKGDFNLFQNEMYKYYGGQAGIANYLYEIKDSEGKVIGFAQEYIPNAVTLDAFERQGGKLSTSEIQEGIDQIKELHEVVGLPHGDLVFGSFNRGNILVQTVFDDDGKIIGNRLVFIDHFGTMFSLAEELFSDLRASEAYMGYELNTLIKQMQTFIWDGVGDYIIN